MARALEEPLRVLCARAGVPFSVLPEVPPDDPWTGWCPVRGGVVDFGEAPAVVDPLGVVLGSLRAAVSVACEVMLTEVVLARPEPPNKLPPPVRLPGKAVLKPR